MIFFVCAVMCFLFGHDLYENVKTRLMVAEKSDTRFAELSADCRRMQLNENGVRCHSVELVSLNQVIAVRR